MVSKTNLEKNNGIELLLTIYERIKVKTLIVLFL